MVQKQTRITGIAISPGIGYGKACIWGTAPAVKRRKIRVGQVSSELKRLEKAVDMSLKQIFDIRDKVSDKIGEKEADIFGAHAMLLRDPVLMAQVEKTIVEQRINAEAAIEEVIDESVKVYATTNEMYLKERIQDFRDVGRRLVDNLAGFNQECLLADESDIIVIAAEITPSQLMEADHSKIKGFVTEMGGETSHVAILARSLGIPLVSGISNVLNRIKAGLPLLVNGFNGTILRQPSNNEIKAEKKEFPRIVISESEIEKLNKLPVETADGHPVTLMANVRSQTDIMFAKKFQSAGIGLYRTELAFNNKNSFPSEEYQFNTYKEVVQQIAPHPVTIRTLDLGGDKFSPYYPYLKKRELNPYLGMRAIRISLARPDILRDQLRAIVRASAHGQVKLLLPMISGVEEIRRIKRMLYRIMRNFQKEGIPFDPDLRIGAMIEIPSAVIVISSILKEVDFISVGTNDLIQYTLAVDRSNETVSQYYEPMHPAVLHLLKQIAAAANREKKEASICGEMAADVRYTKLLIGLGYNVLSMSSLFIPQIKRVVRTITQDSARELAYKALNLWEIKKIKKLIHL
ncbi:phosphoenolpyruvate--protein phosphotransferase [candidate division KSB1 bacterium]|nr:phosphoenolpyruvate--protein phosphotransferase [candidate division KSB1 bacterium]